MTGRATTTDQPTRSPARRRTRRQLLAGGTEALAAVLTAEALDRPTPAVAGTDGDVVLGADNTATTATTIRSRTSGGIALDCLANGGGSIGMSGVSDSGNGVSGQSGGSTAVGVVGTNTGAGSGVLGQSNTGAGVVGTTTSASASGVAGEHTGALTLTDHPRSRAAPTGASTGENSLARIWHSYLIFAALLLLAAAG